MRNAEKPEHHWVPVSDEVPWWIEIENLKRERDKLIDAIRNLRDVKGRHHTQIAADRLFALLPSEDLQ